MELLSWKLICGPLLAYLIGAIPTSVWVGRLFYNTDVREQGSGNAGATNTIRVLGLRAGIPVLLIDILKGWFAVYIAVFFVPEHFELVEVINYKIIMAVSAVIGHVFPVYIGFRGGKGIATLVGVGFALYPTSIFMVLAVFILVLLLSGFVSLASITAALFFPVTELLILGHNDTISLALLSIGVAVFVPITHNKNIIRLLKGEESKIKLSKKKK